jgi:hypothetical protein
MVNNIPLFLGGGAMLGIAGLFCDGCTDETGEAMLNDMPLLRGGGAMSGIACCNCCADDTVEVVAKEFSAGARVGVENCSCAACGTCAGVKVKGTPLFRGGVMLGTSSCVTGCGKGVEIGSWNIGAGGSWTWPHSGSLDFGDWKELCRAESSGAGVVEVAFWIGVSIFGDAVLTGPDDTSGENC